MTNSNPDDKDISWMMLSTEEGVPIVAMSRQLDIALFGEEQPDEDHAVDRRPVVSAIVDSATLIPPERSGRFVSTTYEYTKPTIIGELKKPMRVVIEKFDPSAPAARMYIPLYPNEKYLED